MSQPLVGIVMGSASDWETMKSAATKLQEFGVPFEAKVVSAHRSPNLAHSYATTAKERGLVCIIAAAGMAAHLAGVMAANTTLPVLGVPMAGKHIQGLDALLSTVQMPPGIPVATFGVGGPGAQNAALFAVAMLATNDASLGEKLAKFRVEQEEKIEKTTLEL